MGKPRYSIVICAGDLWSVIDSTNGKPAEIDINGTFVSLRMLTEDVAQALSDWLNEKWEYSAEKCKDEKGREEPLSPTLH